MATNTVTSDSQSPASKKEYDPIQMLRDYMKDNPSAPAYISNYLVNRLGDQMIWYDSKSGFFKRVWVRNQTTIIVLSALIPFLVGLIGMGEGEYEWINTVLKMVVGAAGVSIAILEGLNSLHQSRELFVEYRTASEQLKQEFSYFLGNSGVYAGLDEKASYTKLIANTEIIMAGQNNRWAEIARKDESASQAEEIQNAVEAFLAKNNFTLVKDPSAEEGAGDDTQSGGGDAATGGGSGSDTGTGD
ncbi:MAG: DUF4231 domain-containing protein [Bacteroidota bacterium]